MSAPTVTAPRPRGRPRTRDPAPEPPALSREEYMVLLQTARRMGRKRTYLLIKTIGSTGLNSLEMPFLTVEAVREGRVTPERYKRQRLIQIPEPLRPQLLEYAGEQNIDTGPVFMAQNGVPMSHALIWKGIKQVCREAGVAEELGGPKSLAQMYSKTYKTLRRENLLQTERVYQQLLEREEKSIGWDI